ncbi:hypothetical protein LCGC14_0609800 [marine sediment metagenome]|uniref:Uncharacterized protein n=1 Tax=marine sediment metagenome TaxID=412755 RepID=A0A0F9RCP7_9ZZZZ
MSDDQDTTPKPVVDREEVDRVLLKKRESTRQRRLEKNPNVFVLELGGGQFEYQPMGAMDNAFRINVQGRCWEHVGEDALSRWVYRAVS